VGLEPGGLVGDEGIGGRVGLVEAVFGEFGHLVEDRFGLFGIESLGFGSLQERFLLFGHNRGVFLAHGAAQQVGASQGVTGQGAGDLHDLLLVDDDPVGIL